MRQPSIFEITDFLTSREQKMVLASFDFLSDGDHFHRFRKSSKHEKLYFSYQGFPIYGNNRRQFDENAHIVKSASMAGFRRFTQRLEDFVLDNFELFSTRKKQTYQLSSVTATRFVKGSYLSNHTDGYDNDFAFVYYPAESWQSKNGGNLVFTQGRNELARFAPLGNRLIWFRVPRLHRIEKVKVISDRLAISGWIKIVAAPR